MRTVPRDGGLGGELIVRAVLVPCPGRFAAARSTDLIVRAVLVPFPADLPPHDQPR
jgi:hypothetical protein